MTAEVKTYLLDQKTVCIFPSEVSARFWMERAAAESFGGVVRADRFLSWDRFLEEVCSLRRREKPVNAVSRKVIASYLLQEIAQEQETILSYFILPEFQAQAERYSGMITDLLPHLEDLKHTADTGGSASAVTAPVSTVTVSASAASPASSGDRPEAAHPIPEAMRSDVERLYTRYTEFLKSHDLYEPRFIRSSFDMSLLKTEKRWVLFFPELLMDCDDLLRRFREGERRFCISAEDLQAGNSDESKIRVFENSKQELYWNVQHIEELLAGGTAPQDIAVSLADFDSWYDPLFEQMQLRGLPFVFRRGRKLASYPAARFFEDLMNAVRTGWSLPAVKRLLLHGGFPWRYPEKFRRIVEAGMEHRCIRNIPAQVQQPRPQASQPEAGGERTRKEEQQRLSLSLHDAPPDNFGAQRELRVWQQALSRRKYRDLLDTWKQFSQQLEGIVREKRPEKLRQRMLSFIDTWLDRERAEHAGAGPHAEGKPRAETSNSKKTEAGGTAQGTDKGTSKETSGGQAELFSRVFDFCLERGMQLMETCRELEIEEFRGLYALWVRILREDWYVPQQNAEGISIYPYKVAAGIQAKYHFIVGASQRSSTVSSSPVPHTNEDFNRMFGLEVSDRTDAFIELYRRSGETVFFSCSRRAFDGPQLPPGYFVVNRGLMEMGDISALRKTDAYEKEQFWWEHPPQLEKSPKPQYSEKSSKTEKSKNSENSENETSEPLSALYPLQKSGFQEAYETIFSQKGTDLLKQQIKKDAVFEHILEDRLSRNAAGLPRISPTSLDTFISCPFNWLFRQLLRLEDAELDPGYIDPRDEGNLFHNCMQRFYAQFVGIGKPFLKEKMEVYQAALRNIIEELLEEGRKRHVWMLPVVEEHLRNWLMNGCSAFLRSEAGFFDGWYCSGLEETLESIDKEGIYAFYGRIDRISMEPDGDGLAVIDYKRGKTDSGKQFSIPGDPLPSYQLPLYGCLLENPRGPEESWGGSAEKESVKEDSAGKVRGALYFSVKDGKYQTIYNDEVFSTRQNTIGRERFAEIMEETEEAAQEMMRRLTEVDLTAEGSAKVCARCRNRALCRSRYTLK